jgi:hypothetical protein
MDSYNPYGVKHCCRCPQELTLLEETISVMLNTEYLCAQHRRVPEEEVA